MMTVGNYEFDKKKILGQGAYGKVYEGYSKTDPSKVVAIKKIDTGYHKSSTLPDSIDRNTEARILQTLSNPAHKNVVSLFYYEQQGKHAFFVMEYCNGGNLQEYLKSKGRLDECALMIFLRQIAAGLRVANDKGIVHRDFKPENILLCFSDPNYPDPNNITLKIADFGVGRFLDAKEMARTYRGTPLYMAPDIMFGRPYDNRVDLWSIGVIAFECIVGSLPSTERPMAVQDFEIPEDKISADLANLLKGLLEKDETRRFEMKHFLNHSFLSKTQRPALSLDKMKVVGDYEYDKKDKIGNGVFGRTYRGHKKTDLNAVVAIKEFDQRSHKMSSSPDLTNREISILKTLSNSAQKNVVTLLHSEQNGRYSYLVMEYCNGGNLAEYLHSKRQLGERTLRIFLRQIAAGLKAAHDLHIVHRNLRPENIFLCFSGPKYPDPDSITLKIGDFTLGRFLADEEMASTVCGTPLYMAPEILVGRPYGLKVDLWSTGVIAYECLIGSLPTDAYMAFHDVEIPTGISEDCAVLLNGLLEKDENRRFSINQLINHPFLAAKSECRIF